MEVLEELKRPNFPKLADDAKHVVMFSGGIVSWYSAYVAKQNSPNSEITLLFADTLMEDEDLYRFVNETAHLIGPLVHLKEGRTPWQVFNDVRFLGNSMIDPCSRILKREMCRRWIDANVDPTKPHALYVGLDWFETARINGIRRNWQPYRVYMPLVDPPYEDKKAQANATLKELGIAPPRLYGMGFAHNNCGGFCIKAGKTQFALLLEKMPERYKFHEEREQEIRKLLGKDVTILRETRNFVRHNLTLREYRIRLQGGEVAPDDEIGGCACFTDSDEQLPEAGEEILAPDALGVPDGK